MAGRTRRVGRSTAGAVLVTGLATAALAASLVGSARSLTTGEARSASGGRIALIRSAAGAAGRGAGELYVMDSDGTNARRVAVGPVCADSVAWAPGGKLLVFGREGSAASGPGLWLLDTGSGEETRLTDGSLHREFAPRVPCDGVPAFSPDGARVAFERRYGDGVEGLPTRVFTVDTRTLQEAEVPRSGTALCWEGFVNCTDLCWSTAGAVAFVEAGWLEGGDVWTWAGADVRPVLLTHGPGDGRRVPYPPGAAGPKAAGPEIAHPTWSPDGTRVAFDQGGLWVMDAQRKGRKLVRTWPRAQVRQLAWAPDGRRVAAVVSAAAKGSGLQVVDVDTGRAVAIAGDVYSASWSPAGDALLFSVCEPRVERVGQRGVRSLVCGIDADGGRRTVLTPDGARDCSPVWEPSG